MNTAFDPWIPVVTSNGEPRFVSLNEIFAEGDKFSDLNVRPHERIALMRLFLCIAHAALDGPKDRNDWNTVPAYLPNAARTYLEKWKDSFELFHPTKPWLQVAGLTKSSESTASPINDWTPVSKLSFFLATGHMVTLFDHGGMENDARTIPIEQTIVSMLAFQCFSSGGLISQVFWNGVQTGKTSKDAPCLSASMFHALIRRDTLLDTIHANLLTCDDRKFVYAEKSFGRPVWEKSPKGMDDEEAVGNATQTYVGRLVPMTRLILLNRDGKRMLLGDGLVYPTFADGFPPEPTATVTVFKKQDQVPQRILLSYRPSRAIWRELGALLVIKKSADDIGGPIALRSLAEGIGCDLIIDAVARDQATIVNTMESVYHIPAQLINDTGLSAYQSEVAEAERMARLLGWAVETYREGIDGGWEGRLKTAGAGKAELRGKLDSKAYSQYWTAVEQNLGLLMAHIEAIGTDRKEPTCEVWRKMLFATACAAYSTACGQETPREIKAFMEGKKRLMTRPRDDIKQQIKGGDEE